MAMPKKSRSASTKRSKTSAAIRGRIEGSRKTGRSGISEAGGAVMEGQIGGGKLPA